MDKGFEYRRDFFLSLCDKTGVPRPALIRPSFPGDPCDMTDGDGGGEVRLNVKAAGECDPERHAAHVFGHWLAEEFRKSPGVSLMAARGDLYVEIDKPHRIAEALRLIIGKDPEASVGSRILLSVVHAPVPSCADFLEIAWLADAGYRRMMLCDEICLKEHLLAVAVDAFDQFRADYGR